MNDEPLPKQADLRKLTARGATFRSQMGLSRFPRLASAVHEGQGRIEVDLQCGVNEQSVPYIAGAVSCEASVLCQRCLEPVAIRFASDVNLGVVWGEDQARQLPDGMDPLVVGEDELVDLNEIVEDELLLGLPIVSYHDVAECSGHQQYESADEAAKEVVKENPFKVLEQLKSSKE